MSDVGWSLTSLFSTNMAVSVTEKCPTLPTIGIGASVKGR